jgi:hypothetical protein
MPDVVVHHADKDWLALVEAVTSHGPMNLKRHNELREQGPASFLLPLFSFARPW